MRKKKLSTVKPNLPKEYIWTLDVEGVEKIFKCLVTETNVTTYEDGVEHKHLKITNPECKEGVLQIDTTTKIYGDMVPFQLERFIPYIKLEGRWVMSDTTEDDRVQEAAALHRKNAKQQIISGVACMAVVLGKQLITGDIGDWWMLTVFGIFFIASGLMTLVRVRNELNAIQEAKEKQEIEQETSKILKETSLREKVQAAALEAREEE